MNQLTYKGYVGTAEISEEDGVFFGKLAFIRDLVTYESADAPGLVTAFREAVDDYLADCAAAGRAPDNPFKGQFNVRTKPEIHRALAMLAAREDRSLNDVVNEIFERAMI